MIRTLKSRKILGLALTYLGSGNWPCSRSSSVNLDSTSLHLWTKEQRASFEIEPEARKQHFLFILRVTTQTL